MCSIIPPGPPGVPKSPPRVNIKYLPLLVIDHCFRVKYQLISYKISSSFKCIYQTKSGFRCIYQMTSARHQMSLNKMKYLDLGSLLYYSFGRYNPPGTRPFRCLQYIPMACVLFPFVSKMYPKVSLNKAIVLSSALFSAKLKLFSAKVWKCQHFSAQRRNYQEATARNLFIRDNFDSTSHTALFLREPKRFGRYFSFFFLFFLGRGGGRFQYSPTRIFQLLVKSNLF